MTTTTKLQWKKRAKVVRTELTEARILETVCGKYYVRHTKSNLGPSAKDIKEATNTREAKYLRKNRLSDEFTVWKKIETCWLAISIHKTLKAAKDACELCQR